MIGFYAAGAMGSGGGEPVQWTPADLIVPPRVWLDWDSSLTDSSGDAAAWDNDHGLIGGAFEQATAGNRPSIQTTGLNGKRFLRFDGSNDTLRMTSGAAANLYRNATAGWVFSVICKRGSDVPGTNRIAFYAPTSGGQTRLQCAVGAATAANANILYARRLDADSTSRLDASATPGDWVLRQDVVDWSNGDAFVYLDGDLDNSSLTFTSTGRTADTGGFSNRLGIAADTAAGVGGHADIDLACLIADSGHVQPLSERQRLEGWAAWQAGLEASLPMGHPYKSAAPTVEEVLNRGAWTWFNDARAIYVGGKILIGTVSTAGEIGSYWGAAPYTQMSRHLFTGTGTPDDHDNPGFLRRASDGKILAFYARHNASSYWMAESTYSDSGAEFGTPVNIASQIGGSTFTYANPVQLTGETNEPIYLFYRGGSNPTRSMYLSKSEDGGATWTTGAPIIASASDRPYFKVAQNGSDRIDFLVNDGHPQNVATNNVYHFYYQSGDYFDSYGNSIGPAPVSVDDMTLLWNGGTGEGRGWVWDLCIDGDGHPVAVYAHFPTTSNHHYRYARFDGAAWVQSEICEAGASLYPGELYYSGGLTIDRANVSRVVASREISGKWKLYEYETADGGASFDGGSLLFEPDYSCFRPYSIAGSGKTAYFTGVYETFEIFRTIVRFTD